MYIHNFFADLLLSVRVLFDTHVFRNDRYVRRYEFNIGNRTFQLPSQYQTNFDFPVIIVTLNDETPSYGQRPDVTQGLVGYFNIDQIPVLYNATKETILNVQEEMVNVPITVNINCESQLQAKEVANVIRRWLPLNKFLQFLEFTSFLEVSLPFLNNIYFEPDIDTIYNLYTKLNKRTGQVEYCFSMSYQPLIRLDSISTAIPDSTQRSFQVSADLTYMVQFPLYLYCDKMPGVIEKIDIAIYNTSGFEPICDYPSSKLVNQTSDNISKLEKGYIRRNYVLYESDSEQGFNILDSVTLEAKAVTNKSSRLDVLRTSDDKVLISIDGSETKYKVKISDIALVPDSTTVTIDTDNYLTLTKDASNNITVKLNSSNNSITIKFDPKDFLMDEKYSYNLFSGQSIVRDYSDYTLDLEENSITFTFAASVWNSYRPTLTHPLIIQFYDKEGKFPFQMGGVAPYFAKIRVQPRQTYAIITWTSGVSATSQVEYGLTTKYGTIVDASTESTQTHRAFLKELSPFTTYHYRLIIIDENNNTYTSDDYSFTTNP